MIEHFARQCDSPSTSTPTSFSLDLAWAQHLTFTTPYAHTVVHCSQLGYSKDWVVDSGASYHVTLDLASLALHEHYTVSNNVIIGDGTNLSVANIGSFSLTSLPTPL